MQSHNCRRIILMFNLQFMNIENNIEKMKAKMKHQMEGSLFYKTSLPLKETSLKFPFSENYSLHAIALKMF